MGDCVTVVLGMQWGDEGKGKLVDILCDQADICARCQGGNNAGHTIVADGTTYQVHILPSGLVNRKCTNLIGSGVVIHLPSLFEELAALQRKGLDTDGRLFVSDRAHLVFDVHQITDGLKEAELGGGSLGTTKKGIGPAYSSKASRSGIRVHHLFDWTEFERRFRALVASRHRRYGKFECDVDAELDRYKILRDRLKPLVVDNVAFIHDALTCGKRILIEGANALMLDLDFGTYPFVTSSNTSIGGVCTGLGIPPKALTKIYGVLKAYTTRVGSGPFPTEQINVRFNGQLKFSLTRKAVGEHLQNIGHEWGVTTKRRRRCGWLDLVVAKYSSLINGYTSINMTKIDVLGGLNELKIAVAYRLDGVTLTHIPADPGKLLQVTVEYKSFPGWNEDISSMTDYNQLPVQARNYVEFVENFIGIPISYIGVGPHREAMLKRF